MSARKTTYIFPFIYIIIISIKIKGKSRLYTTKSLKEKLKKQKHCILYSGDDSLPLLVVQ